MCCPFQLLQSVVSSSRGYRFVFDNVLKRVCKQNVKTLQRDQEIKIN